MPVYLGCDWQNVPLHLPSTFPAFKALTGSPHVRVAMLGDYGLTWPWESLHVEALAWFDHWLKGRDTGILEGPRIRYVLPGAEGFREADRWPVPGVTYRDYALRADGGLAADEGAAGDRAMMTLGAGLNRDHASETDPPAFLTWTSAPLDTDLDMVGPIELALDAIATAGDTAFIATLQDVDPSGSRNRHHRRISPRQPARGRRGGEPARRAGLALPYASRRCRSARSFAIAFRWSTTRGASRPDTAFGWCSPATTRIRTAPAIMGFRHASVGTSCLSTITVVVPAAAADPERIAPADLRGLKVTGVVAGSVVNPGSAQPVRAGYGRYWEHGRRSRDLFFRWLQVASVPASKSDRCRRAESGRARGAPGFRRSLPAPAGRMR